MWDQIRHSLKYRIAVIIFALEAVMMAAVLIMTINHSLQGNRAQLEVNEQVMMSLLADLSRIGLLTAEYDDLQPYIAQVVNDPHIDTVLISDHKNRVVVSNDFGFIGKPLPKLEDSESLHWVSRDIKNVSGHLGTLAIQFSQKSIMANQMEAMKLGGSIALTGMFLIAVIGVLIGYLLTRRLEILSDTAKRFASGDMKVRTNLTGQDEVAIVGQAFDKMAHSVAENVDALTKATDQLEQRVEERTLELAEARDKAIEADRSKSAFLATMSHELRTPLTAIIGFSDSLLDPDQVMAERIESIHSIIKGSKHLHRIINDILDVSKIDADKLEIEHIPVNLFEILRDVEAIISLLATEKGLKFSIKYDFPLPEVITSDPLRLKQILINICNNAVKFTEEGSVTVKVSCDCKKQNVIFKVIDTGIGLNADQIERLFKPFMQADNTTTRKFGGTGLGLHLSKKLAHSLGGDISVDSTIDVGSRFVINIDAGDLNKQTPVESMPEVPLQDSQSAQPDFSLSGSVLLVEDHVENQRLISMYLNKAGLEADIANNGQEAVEKALASQYDLVLMDIQMPIMNGIEATQTLRAKGYKAPIVALTANAMKSDVDACTSAGCDDFVSKPIDKNTLYKLLEKYLNVDTNRQSVGSLIVSELLKTEPDLLDIVKEFVAGLPDRLKKLENSYQDNDLETIKSELHQLKGTGGNFGYPILFEMCQKIEFNILASNLDGIPTMLSKLEACIHRIQLGLSDNVINFDNKNSG